MRYKLNLYCILLLFCPLFPDFYNSTAFEGSQVSFLCPGESTCRWGWSKSTVAWHLTRELQSTRRKTCLSATWSNTNFKWTGPALNLGFSDRRLKLVYIKYIEVQCVPNRERHSGRPDGECSRAQHSHYCEEPRRTHKYNLGKVHSFHVQCTMYVHCFN